MIKVNGKFKCGQLNEKEKRRQIAKMLYGFVFAYLTHYTKVIMSFEKSRLVPGSWNHTNKISLPVERIYFLFSLLFILFMFWYEASLVEFMLWFLYGTSIFAFHFGNKCFSEKGGWLENLHFANQCKWLYCNNFYDFFFYLDLRLNLILLFWILFVSSPKNHNWTEKK